MDELGCTQLTEPYPTPESGDAVNMTIPWLINVVYEAYLPIHYYVFVSIVVFSVFANLAVLLVLSRKEMRSFGVNVIMMMIAGCDFFCAVSAVVQLFLRATNSYMSFLIAYIQITSDYLSVAFHASSLYLGVGMALCRVMSLNLSNKNRAQWQSPKYALIVTFSLCTPVFVFASVILFLHSIETDEDGVYMSISDIAVYNECLFLKMTLMISGLCFKAIPCVLMLILSLILLARIEEGKKSSVSAASKQKDNTQKMDRSSRFIQFVVVVFLVTETPQAMVSIAGGLFLVDYLNYIQNLSIFMNVLAFLNSTISFLVYSTLSAKFRQLFMQIFIPKSITNLIHKMDELGCTQFTEPYPSPESGEADNMTIPWLATIIDKTYRPIHYYLFVGIVLFSVFSNCIVLIVLAKKEMRSVGVNCMMMMIAGCDFFCSVWAVVQLFLRVSKLQYRGDKAQTEVFSSYMSYLVGYIQITSDYLAVAFHASSLYLGVGLAFCRVKSLNLSNKNRAKWQSPKSAFRVAFASCTPVFLLASMILFNHEIVETEEDGVYMAITDLSLQNGSLFLKATLVMNGACLKAVPCTMMLILSLILLTRIEEGKKSSVSAASKQKDNTQKMDRSSRFIQIVLVVFLVTESPQAVFGITGGLFLIDYLNYYQNLSIIMNVLAFFNSTTSFLVYSTLSSKFRQLFIKTIFPKFVMDKVHKMEDFGCTQLTEPYPSPDSGDADNMTIPWLVNIIATTYRPVHYYLFVSLAVFSVFSNSIVLTVLARKEMRSVGVNVMMMMIAGCDFFCSVWTVIQLFLGTTTSYMSYLIGYIQITSDYLSVAFHASSLYLGVGMALCRVMSLNLSNKNRAQWQSPKYALFVAFSMCTPVFVLASMILFLHTMKESKEEGVYIDISDFSMQNNCIFLKATLVMNGACLKAVPCIMMLILSMILLARIKEGKKSSVSAASKQKENTQKIDRSSRFIQFVLVVFLVTEIPQAVYSITGGLFLIDYFNYYQNLSVIMKMLSSLNSTTSFLVYSTLSSKFRQLFTQIFFPKSITDVIYKKLNMIAVQSSATRTS